MNHRLILNIRFWVWAAMHSPNFEYFRIGFSRFIAIRPDYYKYHSEKFVIRVSLFTPHFVYEVDYTTAKDLVKSTKACTVDDLYKFEDIPF